MKKITFLWLLLASVAQASPNIIKMEYFIGSDPGFDAATAVAGLPVQQNISGFVHSITPNLPLGISFIGYRSKDANNVWSHTNFITVYVTDTSNAQILEVEYFWDVDPGFGNATDTILAVSQANLAGNLSVKVPDTLSPGIHYLFMRSRESRGRWSHTNYADSVWVSGVGIEVLQRDAISIYPNPTDAVLNVKIARTSGETTQLTLTNTLGQTVIRQEIKSGNLPAETQLDLSALPGGMYFLMVRSDGMTRSFKAQRH